MKALAAVLLPVLALASPGPAAAQARKAEPAAARKPAADPTAQAKEHFRKGTELYRQARYREAIAEFEAAQRLRPHGVLHFNIAQCHERLGDIPAALQNYHEYLRAQPQAEDRDTVLSAMHNLEARLGAAGVQQLLVYSDPPGAEVLVNGQSRGRTPLAVVLPHGSHAVALLKQGYRTVNRQALLSPQASVEIDVTLQKQDGPERAVPLPPPPVLARPADAGPARAAPASATAPPPPPAAAARGRTWPRIAAGAAVAALGAGAAYGLSARSSADQLRAEVHDGATAQRLASQATSRARTATVLFAAGGAAAAGAGVLFLVEGRF